MQTSWRRLPFSVVDHLDQQAFQLRADLGAGLSAVLRQRVGQGEASTLTAQRLLRARPRDRLDAVITAASKLQHLTGTEPPA